MPKIKTRKGLAKRIRITGSGKLMRGSAFRNHYLERKSMKRKRGFENEHAVAPGDRKTVRRALGV